LGAGALLLAAGAFLLGRGTAHASPSSLPTATALSALNSVASAPTGPGNAACAGPRKAAGGTLKSVSGSTLTVTSPRGGDVTVKTDSNTKVTKIVKGGLGDVTSGAVVAIHGTPKGTTAIAADQVAVLPANTPAPPGKGPAGKGPGAFGPKAQGAGFAVGTVQSVSASGFTVLSGGSTVTITTSSSTTFSKTVAAAVSDLVTGQPIAVGGTPNSDGSITASNIQQAGPGVAAGKLPGIGFGRPHP
jgi:hypothetical protein